MPLTSSQPMRCRSALAAALFCLGLAGCSAGDPAGTDDVETDPRSEGADASKRVSAVGVSFEVPEGWEELDAAELADGAGDTPQMAEMADGMGITPDQLEQTVRMMDLFLVSGEGAQHGFLDNLNVLQVPGPVPNESQVKLSFLQLGAEIEDITHERTGLGDTIDVRYLFEIGDARVQGEAIFVEVDDKPVSVTISASDRDTTDEIADQVLDTLAEAS